MKTHSQLFGVELSPF